MQPVLISYRRNSRFNPGGPCRPPQALTCFSSAPITHLEGVNCISSKINLRFVGLRTCTVFVGSLFAFTAFRI